MKYFIKTYGCQMNYSDSERIASVLELSGYKKTLLENKADLIVINACSVRKSAVDRIAGNFKKYNKFKKKNPNLKIVLTGCVLESDRERFEKLFDSVIDIKEIKQLHRWLHSPEGLWNPSAKQQKCSTAQEGSKQCNYFQIKPHYQSKFSAYVPIMTGCNNFCSYCVVPYTRGREYSRPVEEVLNEITELVEKGYKEIILLGQNVNSYKSRITDYESRNSTFPSHINIQDKPKQKSNETNWIPASAGMTKNAGMTNDTVTFPKLLKLINNIPGDFWIRFLTSHPKDMTEELIKTLAECEKVTPHIHLALQSGDDEILKKMNRKYTTEHFLNLIELIRKYLPDAAITTDIIVGFPSETEKQFQKTAEVMKKAKFDMVYINKYSPRENIESYKMKDNISWEEKKERERILTKILKETALENNQKYVGKVVEVLVEKVDDDFIYGKTRSFKNVKMTVSSIVPIGLWNRNAGEFIKVKITKARFWNLKGKIVK